MRGTGPAVLLGWRVGVAGHLLFLACGLSAQAPLVGSNESLTFVDDVAPILRSSCQSCHEREGMAPMPLTTYAETRRWASLIKDRVEARMMPPWHMDRAVGIQSFKNDPSLTDQEIATIVAWIEGGMLPGGPPQEEPLPESSRVDGWRLAPTFGEPDLVIASEPYSVPPNGSDQWWNAVTESGLEYDRWIRAIEVRPSFPAGHRVTHHLTVSLQDDTGTRLLTEWAMGKVGEVMPERTGRFIRAGTNIGWDVHYFPVGEAAPGDQVSVGLWFYPVGYEPEFENRLQLFRADPMDGPRGAQIDIPPGEIRSIRGSHTLTSPLRIESYQPHMHLRGVAMSMEAEYPDGRRELLSHVDRFRHNWQISYKYSDEAMPLLPAGTRLIFTAWHDNSADNPNNPDPSQWVGFGRRTVDEMAHAWVGITYLSEEQFIELVAERSELESHGAGAGPN